MIKQLRTILVAFLAVGTIFALVAPAANAKSSYGVDSHGNKCVYSHKKPSKKAKYKRCSGQVTRSATTETSAAVNPFLAAVQQGISVAGAESSAESKVTILSYIKAKGLSKTQMRKMKCQRRSGGYWNSGHGSNGRIYWFWDTRPGTICRSKSGGLFRAECGNAVRTKAPSKKVRIVGKVKLVRSFGSFHVHVSVSEHVRVNGECGFAEASASASASARGRSKAQAKGNARILASAQAKASAYARAVAMIHCVPTTPPPPPPVTPPPPVQPPPPHVDHAPQITCVYPAHVFQGGNVYIWCEASDSDGDALSVNIVGDSHAHVSGVIPVDVRWDGTSCPQGVSCYRATLWGDSVGTAHIVATVTANGKSATATGDVPVKPDQF